MADTKKETQGPPRMVSSSTRWKLLFLWILVGIVLAALFDASIDSPLLPRFLVHEPQWRTQDFPLMLEIYTGIWVLVCLLLGVCQYLLIRRHIAHAGWWILTIPIGMPVLGLGLGYVVFMLVHGPDDVIVGASLGTGVGVLQWLMLRRHFRSAFLWIVACALGSLVGHLVWPIVCTGYTGLGSSIVAMEILTGLLLFFWLRTDAERSMVRVRG